MKNPARSLSLLLSIVAILWLAPVIRAADSPLNLRRTVIVDVAEKTKNAVVYISTTKMGVVRVNPFGDDPMFAPFSQTYLQRVGSLGSGFIIHKDGYIVTNNHVIQGAREINVELLDGRKFSAELISSNPDADLAILRVQSDKPLPTLDLGGSSDLMIGEPVIAVGNPLGFSHSVSTGIVSALHRDLTGPNKEQMNDLVQTDAAINPGNSGGPLLNAYGQVIGINCAIRSDAQNIGFAIPVDRLRDQIPELMSPEHASKTEVPIKLNESRRILEPATVESTIRVDGTNEIVHSIAGVAPHDIVDAYAILRNCKPDESIDLVTDKGTQTIKAKPVAVPDIVVQARKKLGLTVEQMTPMQAGKLGIDLEWGVLITAVEKSSIADQANLQPNDILVQIGNQRVTSLDNLAWLLQHMPKRGKVFVGIVRPGMAQMGRTFFDFGPTD
jgi:serine protease Do